MMFKKTATYLLAVALLVGQLGVTGCSGGKDPLAACASASRDPLAPKSLQLPEIQAALATKKEIDRHRITLCSYNENMDQVITETVESIPDVGPITSASNEMLVISMIDDLIESTRALRVMAHEILEQKDKYLVTLRSFEKPIGRAPAELRRAAELFQQFSDEEEYEAFQEDYAVMSQMFLALANRYEMQQEQLEKEFNEESFRQLSSFITRGGLMLDRFEAALIVARSSNGLPEAMHYVESIRTFIRTFEEFRTKIRHVNEMLDEPKEDDTGYRVRARKTSGRAA